MTEAEAILSREALDSLLDDPELREEIGRRAAVSARRPRPFERALAIFADDQSRLAATNHQRPIRFRLLSCTPVPVSDFAVTLVEDDRAFVLDIPQARGTGAIVIGRSLLFGWLSMAFGAPANLDTPVPTRPYTRIEARFLRRLVVELAAQLGQSMSGVLPGACEVGEMVEPELLGGLAAPRLVAAAFEVVGLGEPGRLRIAFPEAWIDDADRGGPRAQDREKVRLEQLLEVPVEIRAEVGHAEISLRRASGLQVGDEIPIKGFPDGGIRVLVGGKPRFKAVRGSAGSQAAIRIVSE